MVLFYASGMAKTNTQILPILANKCDEEGIFFCVIGYPEELEVIEKQVDMTSIAAEIPRPFEAQDVAEKIIDLVLRRSAVEAMTPQQKDLPVIDKHRLLLCDDDVMFLKMMQEWLGDKYQVMAVKTGMMAVSIAAKSQPELMRTMEK